MSEIIVNFFRSFIHNDYITVLIVSMVPFVEVRGSIPIAIALGMNVFVAIALAFAGSLIIAPIILLLLKPIMNWLKKFKLFKSFIISMEQGFQGKADKVVQNVDPKKAQALMRKKMLGTYLFVAFPVPMTGVWTGSAVATFLEIPFWRSVLVISLGNLTASIIMGLLSYFFADYIGVILLAVMIIVVVAICAYIASVIVRMVKNKKNKQNLNNENSDEVIEKENKD